MPATITVIDNRTVIRVGENTVESARQAGIATSAANAAAAAGNYFSDLAAGEAGTTTGEFFSYSDGAGGLIYAERAAVGSNIIAEAVTQAQLNTRVATTTLSSASGAGLVGYQQVGAPEIISAASLFASRPVALEDYRASADTEDTTALIRALDAGRRSIYLPAGRGLGAGGIYPIGMKHHATGEALPAGTLIYGDGPGATIVRPVAADESGVFDVESGSAVAYVEDVRLRDMQIYGYCETAGFNEGAHLIRFNGAKDCRVENVLLKAFQGDGIYLGSGNLAAQERHNVNVHLDVVADGVNNCNRNAISIIDGLGVTGRLVARNCTRFGDGTTNYPTTLAQKLNPNYGLAMPGPLDIEPDANIYARIGNFNFDIDAENCGGGALALLIKANDYLTLTQRSFVARVRARNCSIGFNFNGYSAAGALTGTESYGVEVTLDLENCNRIGSFNGAKGVTLKGRAIDCGSMALGNTGAANADMAIAMDFLRCGNTTSSTPGNVAVISASTSNVRFDGSTFEDCGVDTAAVTSRLFYVTAGAHTGLSLKRLTSPTIRKGASNNSQFLGVAGGSGATFDANSSRALTLLGWTASLADTVNLSIRLPSVLDTSYPVTYLNSWAGIGGGEAPEAYADAHGYIHFGGGINAGTLTNGTTIANLPLPAKDFRITGDCRDAVGLSLGVRSFRVPTTSGRVTVDGGDLPVGTVNVRFNNVSYRAA